MTFQINSLQWINNIGASLGATQTFTGVNTFTSSTVCNSYIEVKFAYFHTYASGNLNFIQWEPVSSGAWVMLTPNMTANDTLATLNSCFGGYSVIISGLTTGQTLVFNGANWVNSTFTVGTTTAQTQPGNETVYPGAGTVMAGLAIAFTPTGTGNVMINIEATLSAGNSPCTCTLAYGTGTAPANDAAQTGTTFGAARVIDTTGISTFTTTLPITGYVSGLTPSTAYWFDLQVSGAGPVLSAINAIVQEMPY